MVNNYEKIDLNTANYRVQKLINNEWASRFKTTSKDEALQKLQEMTDSDISKHKPFQYRVVYIEELVLHKSVIEKPDDVTDIF